MSAGEFLVGLAFAATPGSRAATPAIRTRIHSFSTGARGSAYVFMSPMSSSHGDFADTASAAVPAHKASSGVKLLPIATVALLVAVAGCGGGGEDSAATSTASTSSSSSASATSSAGTSTASGEDATPGIVSAANAFLATLSTDEKSTVLFDWSDTAQKTRWSNLPPGLYERDGLMVGNLSTEQVNAFLAVMQATLSTEGYQRVVAEWTADEQLAAQGGGNYGKQYYFIAIIGEPSETDPWQWQFGGHHVTVNATIAGADISLTPSFIGAQPATYDDSGTTVRPLGDIEDEAFALVNSLDSTEQGKAVLGSSPIDLVLGPGQDGKTIQSEGLPASEMSAEQQTALLNLVDEYGGLANDEDAASREAELKADLAETYFAWYGPTTAGSAAYFRVTGPHVVIEYSPQSMGGDAANHIHGIYRDPTNDYGAAITS